MEITSSRTTKKSLEDCLEFFKDPETVVSFLETSFGIKGIKPLEEGKTYSGKAEIGGTEYNTTVTYQDSVKNQVKYLIDMEKYKFPVSIQIHPMGEGSKITVEIGDILGLSFIKKKLAALMIQSKLGEGLKAFIEKFEEN